jgi:hypothetical protein
MNKPISTKVHGVLDYLTAPTLIALPRALGWSKGLTNLLTGSGLGLLGYSMMTRYELGLFKVLPMRRHLTLDAMSGAMLAATPFLPFAKQDRNGTTISILVGLGAFEIAASLLTQPQPSLREQLKEASAGPNLNLNALREKVTTAIGR